MQPTVANTTLPVCVLLRRVCVSSEKHNASLIRKWCRADLSRGKKTDLAAEVKEIDLEKVDHYTKDGGNVTV